MSTQIIDLRPEKFRRIMRTVGSGRTGSAVLAEIGTRSGGGRADWVLYDGKRVVGGVVVGGTGSGKSNALEVLAVNTLVGEDGTEVWHIDPHHGANSSALHQRAARKADSVEEADGLLRAALAEVDRRSAKGWLPGLRRPRDIFVFVQEGHLVFEDDPQGWADLVERGPAVGIAVVAAVFGTRSMHFGHSEELRDALLESGNVLILPGGGLRPGERGSRLPRRAGVGLFRAFGRGGFGDVAVWNMDGETAEWLELGRG